MTLISMMRRYTCADRARHAYSFVMLSRRNGPKACSSLSSRLIHNPISMATFSIGAAFTKSKAWVLAHKIWTGIILVVVLWGGYSAYASFAGGAKATSYVLGTVDKGTVVATVSGSGQVSAVNDIELSPKTSGTLVSVAVKAGDTVAKGALIAAVDPGTSGFELQSAKLAY